jgi:hypothetical protein
MKKVASLVALLGMLSSPALAEDKYDQAFGVKKSRPYSLGVGFNLAHIPESSGTTEFLAADREMFNKSMPIGDDHTAFGKFLQVGNIKPSIELNGSVDFFELFDVNLLPKDGLKLGPYVGFGSSHIFGDQVSKQTFDAEIEHPLLSEPAQLGSTPTEWTQHLDYLVQFGADLAYKVHDLGVVDFKLGVKGGAFYIKSSSTLDIYVESEGPFTGKLEQGGELTLPWPLMNTIANTYQSIITEAVSKGWGGEVFPYVSVESKFGNFGIELKVGYGFQFQPELEISKETSSDPTRVDNKGELTGKVEESVSTINNDTQGIAGTLLLKFYFGLE